MKRHLLFKSLLLLCALVVGSSAWATDMLYSQCLFGSSYGTNSDYTSTWTTTNGSFSWSVANGNTNGSSWNLVKFGRNGKTSIGTVTTSAAYTVPITKVTVSISAITSSKINSIKLYTKTATGSWSEAGSFTKGTGDKTVELASPAANLLYKVEFDCASGSSNGLISVTAINYYIENVAITSISLPSTQSVAVGGTVTLTPTVAPSGYTEAIDWESDDTDVATVSSTGVVTGKAAGTAHIKAKAHDNPTTIYGECTVTVTAPIAVTGVTLKSSTTIEVGKTETLVPTILPANATNKTVAWFSNDDTKVSVDDDGVITGLAVTGETPVTITVMTEDGYFEAECAVTVIPKNTDVNLTSPISITEWPSISYKAAAEYEVEGVCFTATQCMNSSGLQFKKSEGILASPLINSTNGYTVIVTTNGQRNPCIYSKWWK